MKKITLSLIAFVLVTIQSNAQTVATADTSWKKGGFIGINFTQLAQNNEWTKGGENAISFSGLLNLFANYEKGKQQWSNTLNVNYALTKLGNTPLRKSDDRFEFTSKYGHKLKGDWNYVTTLNFATQLTDGKDYSFEPAPVTSKFLAPAYATIGLGFEYRPNDNFSLAIHPVSGRVIIDTYKPFQEFGAFGIDTNKAVKFQIGAWLLSSYKKEIGKNVTFATALSVFDPYDDIKHADINWDLGFVFKINKYLNASANATVRYFDAEIQRTQFREGLNIGIGIKL